MGVEKLMWSVLNTTHGNKCGLYPIILMLMTMIFSAHFQVVIFRDGTYMTLKEVFESLDLTG